MRTNLFAFFIALAAATFAVDAFCLTTPNMSANTLFLFRNSNFHKEDTNPANVDNTPNGFDVQEAELQIYSDVDPYTRLNLLLSVSPSFESDGTQVEEKWGIEPEEVFAESNVISDVTFKIGKFKAFMGKHNLLHTHAYPFIEAPLANTKLLGDEGFNDPGVSAAILLPSSWFSEGTLQYLRGKGENAEFNSPSPAASVGLAHWKNLVDLSDALTMEVGVSYAKGGNSYRKTTTLSGADLTFKWRPTEGGLYHSLVWATEYLGRTQEQAEVENEKSHGVATWIQYQFAERWAGLYRYDTLTTKDTFDPVNLPDDTWKRHSLALVYSPSEFSSFKMEFDQRNGGTKNANGDDTEKSIFLQANFTIGAHPAHAY
jgi:hypothetical protein